MGEGKKSLFDYDNYREFLRDFYLTSKARNKNFSFRYFSRIAGFKSPNILKLVMDGERNIAPHSIDKFVKAMKLNREESLFFRNLVLLNQSTSVDDKQHYIQEILKSRTYKRIHPLKEAQYNFFSRWYCALILEMVAIPGFREDPHWIAKQIHPPITPTEVRRVLDELLEMGLIQRNPEGKLMQANPNLSSPDEVISTSIAQCHREMMKRAAESIDLVPRENRDISGVTFGMSRETMKEIKEMLQNFRREVLKVASRDSVPDGVYQLNFQLFPLMQISKSEVPDG